MKKSAQKPTGVLSSSDLKTAKGKAIYGIFFIILVLLAVVSVVPAIWAICQGFKESQEIYAEFSFWPKDMSWSRIVTRISESWNLLQFDKYFLNTILLSIGDLIVSIIVCGFGGYALSKIKPAGAKLIFTLVVWTMMMPGQIRIVPNYISWLHFPFAFDTDFSVSLLDTYWPMWLSAGADTFAVLLFKNAFDGLSNSYVEAARLDGCTDYGVFFKIMLPLAMPVIIYQSINMLSVAWSDFFTPLLVLDENKVVPLVVYGINGNKNIKINTYFMALVFASIPPFIIYILFHKQIMGGVNIGGVKG